MVNSKKMSKSSIAVIVLSILLVLSMILGLTGAWFTSKADGTLADNTIKFGTVKVTAEADAQNGIYHKNNSPVAAETDGSYLLVAGDYVKAKYSFTNGSDVPVFYVIMSGGQAYEINASGSLVEITDNKARTFEKDATIAIDFSFTIADETDYNDTIEVNGSNVDVVAGATISVGAGTYQLRMMQATNTDDGAAYTFLKTDSNWTA